MLLGNHIRDTIENFFLCTYIPIRAYRNDGYLICSAGYTEQLEKDFNSSELFITAKNTLIEKKGANFIDVNYIDNIKFTISNICPCNTNEGFFIIGPYTTEKTSDSTIIFKPEFCIPHIVSLLHSISKDTNIIDTKFFKTPTEPYSFYIKKAIDYIEKNYNKSISLDDISKILEINKCYFCSLFKSEIGKTYSKYINELRIEKSKKLLFEGTLSLLDIALSVGYNNQNYFNMMFKKLTNMTPLEYRNGSTIY